ncbi:hypothetical protein [Porcincola intestinalis]|uniref:hypothetical protein n=1 Tax=Porcincola intestinalis TaxID=2606632 RepID=UPI002A821A30|nr:hypothetical protein [Porcincola intestinalis]MDY4203935.1 hypothetical protein [Porcincola intestinalis]
MNHKTGLYRFDEFSLRAARTLLICALALVTACPVAFSAPAAEWKRQGTEKQNGERTGKPGEKTEQAEEQTEPETERPSSERLNPGAGLKNDRNESERGKSAEEKDRDPEEELKDGDREPVTDDQKEADGGETETPQQQETEAPEWEVVLSDIHPELTEGGRIYDGTDQIRIAFSWKIRRRVAQTDTDSEEISVNAEENRTSSEELPMPPKVSVTCDARLESPDAGRQKVLYEFRISSEDPETADRIHFADGFTKPDLVVEVKKKLLSVTIPDGKKVYGKPAQMAYIWPDTASEPEMNADVNDRTGGTVPPDRILRAEVAGFLTDEKGHAVIPEDFEAPEVTVDQAVLQSDSPMYMGGKDAVYEGALVMKRRDGLRLTGNPTENYEFCEDEKSPLYRRGSVRIMHEMVREGVHFEIEGERILRRDEKLIIRRGGGLEVRIKKNTYYNRGYKIDEINEDGTLQFRLTKTNRKGELLARSLPVELSVMADGQVPPASLIINDARMNDGIAFTASGCQVKMIPQPDDRSGMRGVRYRVRRGSQVQRILPDPGSWVEGQPDAAAAISLQEEGIWQIEAESQDLAGNVAAAYSNPIVVDHESPLIEVDGVSDGGAYSGIVRIVCSIRDRWYQKGSASIQFSSLSGGKPPLETGRRESEEGVEIQFADFDHTKEADAWYHMTVSAQDLAGSVRREELIFCINRHGSVYGLEPESLKKLQTYYHTEPFDVVFLESNISDVKNTTVLVMKDGKKTNAEARREMLSHAAGNTGIRRYRHVVAAAQFQESGVYDVILMTSDQAGNHADSQRQNLPVRFAIDTEPPQCLVSGIEKFGVYRADELTVGVHVRDNLALRRAVVYLNAETLMTYSARQLRGNGGILKITLDASQTWQRLQIFAADEAGNEGWTEEYPLLISRNGAVPERKVSGESARELADRRKASETEEEVTRVEWYRRGQFEAEESALNRDSARITHGDSHLDSRREKQKWTHRQTILTLILLSVCGSVCLFIIRKVKTNREGKLK